MRKSQVTISIQTPLENEPDLVATIIAFLQDQKTQGKIDKADVTTQEIEVPTHVTI